MNTKDHEAIAGVIAKASDNQFFPPTFGDTLIEALANYMAAEVAHEKAICSSDFVLHEFDRAAFIAACYGEKA